SFGPHSCELLLYLGGEAGDSREFKLDRYAAAIRVFQSTDLTLLLRNVACVLSFSLNRGQDAVRGLFPGLLLKPKCERLNPRLRPAKPLPQGGTVFSRGSQIG